MASPLKKSASHILAFLIFFILILHSFQTGFVIRYAINFKTVGVFVNKGVFFQCGIINAGSDLKGIKLVRLRLSGIGRLLGAAFFPNGLFIAVQYGFSGLDNQIPYGNNNAA